MHKEFTELMNDIMTLEEGESISRDRFRGYLERVRGVNDNSGTLKGEKNNQMGSYQ